MKLKYKYVKFVKHPGNIYECIFFNKEGENFYVGEFVQTEEEAWVFNSDGWMYLEEEWQEILDFWKQLKKGK